MGKKEKETDPESSTNPSTKVSCMALYGDEFELGSFVCNWDFTNPDNARLIFLAEVPTEAKANDLVGTDIAVQYWICTKIEIPDRQNGGVTQVVRSVLIGPNDETVSTLSHGIVKSVDLMRRTFGDQPYVPPIPMTIKGASVGTGSDMLMLVPKALEAKK